MALIDGSISYTCKILLFNATIIVLVRILVNRIIEFLFHDKEKILNDFQVHLLENQYFCLFILEMNFQVLAIPSS